MKNQPIRQGRRVRPGLWPAVALSVALAGAVPSAWAADAEQGKESEKKAGGAKQPASKPPSTMEQIQATQKQILERLDAQDKVLKDIQQRLQAPPQAAARPQMDPNKVYTIALGNSPIRGPKEAPVTVVEFSDYQ